MAITPEEQARYDQNKRDYDEREKRSRFGRKRQRFINMWRESEREFKEEAKQWRLEQGDTFLLYHTDDPLDLTNLVQVDCIAALRDIDSGGYPLIVNFENATIEIYDGHH